MLDDISIPAPPHSIIVVMHRTKQICLGQPTLAFDAEGRKVPFYAKDKIVAYQLWDGDSFHICNAAFCEMRWHIAKC